MYKWNLYCLNDAWRVQLEPGAFKYSLKHPNGAWRSKWSVALPNEAWSVQMEPGMYKWSLEYPNGAWSLQM